MIHSGVTAGRTSMLALLCALGACAHVTPGASPEAAARQVPPNVQLVSQPTTGQEVGAVVNNKVTVNFPVGSTQLSPQADEQLDLAARLFRDVRPAAMFVSGYADQSGPEYPNLLISAQRAQVVKEGLVARGIAPDRLLLQAFGQSEPAVRTDPTAEANRRVVITWSLL